MLLRKRHVCLGKEQERRRRLERGELRHLQDLGAHELDLNVAVALLARAKAAHVRVQPRGDALAYTASAASLAGLLRAQSRGRQRQGRGALPHAARPLEEIRVGQAPRGDGARQVAHGGVLAADLREQHRAAGTTRARRLQAPRLVIRARFDMIL
jgi:hypothetical protein